MYGCVSLSGVDGEGNICRCQTHAGLEGCEGMSKRERMRKACKRQQPTTVAALCVCIFGSVHMFVRMCVSICGLCVRPTAVCVC